LIYLTNHTVAQQATTNGAITEIITVSQPDPLLIVMPPPRGH